MLKKVPFDNEMLIYNRHEYDVPFFYECKKCNAQIWTDEKIYQKINKDYDFWALVYYKELVYACYKGKPIHVHQCSISDEDFIIREIIQ